MANVNMSTFLTDLAKYAKDHNLPVESFFDVDDKKTMSDYTQIGKIYNKVVDFLASNQIYNSELPNNVFCLDRSAMESMNPTQSHVSQAGMDDLYTLAVDCGVPADQMTATMAAMHRVIDQVSNRTMYQDHWMTGTENMHGLTPMSAIYPAAALADMVTGANARPGMEAFGATVDTVIPDLRMALTVVLIKPHKGVMSRLIQRRTLAGAVITYVITRNELYDLQKSQDKMSYVRNNYEHRHNLVELYRRPDPTDMSLTKIVPLTDNEADITEEEDKVLVKDGLIKFNKSLNLFDLVLDQEKAYRNRFNYTDLVSEGVLVDNIYLKVNGKEIKVHVGDHPRARLMHLQTSEQFSGDRETTLNVAIPLYNQTLDVDGAPLEGFEDVSVEENGWYVQARVSANFFCDIMTADVRSLATVSVVPVVAKREDVDADDSGVGDLAEAAKTFADSVEVELVGYELDARYSEENLRQIDRAARSLTYVVSFEMPQGKTIIVDFSMNQSMPEQVLNVAQELQSIGIDHRNTQMFLKTMRDVHDRCVLRDMDEKYNENTDGKEVNRMYISGQQVNPEIFMGTFDLAQVASIRDSDMAGDIRQHFNSYLTKVMSIVHYKSQYLTQLDSNKVPTYKVLTSSPILENIMAIPHIHEHLMPNGMNAEKLYKEKNPGEPIEYSFTLMSGVKLDVITSAFYYLEDKIIILPFIEGDPSNVLNFAHNWDLGQFVANYTPVDNNQVNRRVFMNTREWPIITCPIGAIIEVAHLKDKIPFVMGDDASRYYGQTLPIDTGSNTGTGDSGQGTGTNP